MLRTANSEYNSGVMSCEQLGVFLILWEDYLAIEQPDRRNSKKIQCPKMPMMGDVELIVGKHSLEIGLLCGAALSFLADRHSDHSDRSE